MTIRSGPPVPELPFRYGCVCGAVWNSDEPLPKHKKHLCGPFCAAFLTELKEEE